MNLLQTFSREEIKRHPCAEEIIQVLVAEEVRRSLPAPPPSLSLKEWFVVMLLVGFVSYALSDFAPEMAKRNFEENTVFINSVGGIM